VAPRRPNPPAQARSPTRSKVNPGIPGQPRWPVAYLLDVILNRDLWMHRVDLARATGRPLVIGDHDQQIVAQVIRDLALAWSTVPVTAVGALVEPHLHTREDEYSIVTKGEIGFRSGDREVVLGAGGYITKPLGELHAMWNAGTVPARMIEIISPAGLEHLFRWLADLVEVGLPPLAQVAALAARYGVEFGDPEWLPDIIDRYQLIPPMP
jgi:mannose-6-phosphate isomerase-like protein (cupin superfamily)